MSTRHGRIRFFPGQNAEGRVDGVIQQVLLCSVYLDAIESLRDENPEARKAVLRAFKKRYLRETEESLKDGTLHGQIHQDAQFLREAPRTSRFIHEALMS